jgi:mannose-6-phosphate isomerase-like protein (cupin superfamily)
MGHAEGEEHLDGRIRLSRLGGDAAAGAFRGGDARGRVAWPARGIAFTSTHVVEFARAGVRRGFHRHPRGAEHLYVFAGGLRMVAEAGGVRVELRLEEGDRVSIAPGVAHGFTALEPTVAVAYGEGPDPLADKEPAPEL